MLIKDMRFVWRCDRCGTPTVLTGEGGTLECICEDQPHNNWHFQALTPHRRFELEVWYDPNDLAAPGVRSLP
jgi:hypothetical protein